MRWPLALAVVLAASRAHADPPKLERVDPPPGARAQAITATAVSAIFLGAGVYSYVRAEQRSHDAADLFANNAPAAQQLAAIDSADHWHDATYVFAGVTVVSLAVTGYLWGRAQPTYQVAVTPQGASVGFATSW